MYIQVLIMYLSFFMMTTQAQDMRMVYEDEKDPRSDWELKKGPFSLKPECC